MNYNTDVEVVNGIITRNRYGRSGLPEHHLIVREILSDFIQFFHLFMGGKSLDKTVEYINTGCCYMASHMVGQVLIQKYKMEPKFKSHCLHAWFEVDDVAYDTLYPSGYPRSVVEEWWLEKRKYNTSTLDIGQYGGEGYTQLGYNFHFFCKAWFARYDIKPTRILEHTLRGAPSFRGYSFDKLKMKSARNFYRARYLRLWKVPLFKHSKDVEGIMTPYTHYTKGEFEEEVNN